jgi:hypothetical protein
LTLEALAFEQDMTPGISPIEMFFRKNLGEHFAEEIGIRDPAIVAYVMGLLLDCCEGAVISESNTTKKAHWFDQVEKHNGFDRERQIRKFMGDSILFLTGMAPERVSRLVLWRSELSNFVELIKAGKESYYFVSKFEQFPYAKDAPLFAKLSNSFEEMVYGLNMTEHDLEEKHRAMSVYFTGPALENRVNWLEQLYFEIWSQNNSR